MSHNPVGQVIGAGIEGGLQGGIEGAITGIVLSTIALVGSDTTIDRIFPAGTPKGDLELRYWAVMRPHAAEIGKLWMDRRFGEGVGRFAQSGAPIPNSRRLGQEGRRGVRVIAKIFNESGFHELQSLTVQLEGGAALFAPAATPVSTPEALPVSPEDGGKPVVIAKVKSGNINEGLGSEFDTDLSGFEMGSLINPTLDVGRFIKLEQVVGKDKAFKSNFTVPLGTTSTLLRVDVADALNAKGGTVFVRRATFSVSPNAGVTVPSYRLFAGAARTGSTTIVSKLHYEVIRKNISASLDSTYADGERGSFSTPTGFDYICVLITDAPAAVRVSVGIEAVFLPPGVNGSKC